jgi:hypothetical protein
VRRRFILTTAILTLAHFVLLIVAECVAGSAYMKALDHPEYQPGLLARLADGAADVLIQPVYCFWTSGVARNMPDLVEWLVVFANSLLWGFVLSLLISAPRLLRRRTAARPFDA